MKKICAAAVLFLGFAATNSAEAQELKGSPDSVAWQYLTAEREGLPLFMSQEAIRLFIEDGTLVPLYSNPHLAFANVSFPYAWKSTQLFLDMFEEESHSACQEGLTVTSGTRAHNRQPANASPISVHTRGMALDLRFPRQAGCRRWLERRALELEALGVIDITLERNPRHYHIAVRPAEFLAFFASENDD